MRANTWTIKLTGVTPQMTFTRRATALPRNFSNSVMACVIFYGVVQRCSISAWDKMSVDRLVRRVGSILGCLADDFGDRRRAVGDPASPPPDSGSNGRLLLWQTAAPMLCYRDTITPSCLLLSDNKIFSFFQSLLGESGQILETWGLSTSPLTDICPHTSSTCWQAAPIMTTTHGFYGGSNQRGTIQNQHSCLIYSCFNLMFYERDRDELRPSSRD